MLQWVYPHRQFQARDSRLAGGQSSVNVASILSSVLSAAPTAQPLPTTRALADPCSVLTPADIRAELGWMPAQSRAAGEGLWQGTDW
jgi:hypothetical protein